MYTVKAMCLSYILFTIFMLWGWTGNYSSAKAVKKNLEQVSAVESSAVTRNDYKTFKEHVRKSKQISETLLARKEVQDMFNKEIVAKGIKIDYTDPAQTGSIVGFILSGLCSACAEQLDECACLQLYECNRQCPL
ncbi:uncharacterized protein LOC132745663 [Ruditapes philippinarum]|uniref:uncharacterized protein LOC132745663 n=1 Tax=Ruditapes philippinarum TaxID=129788 RepID=UPI00295B096E|nr:uncharacterized protein LOC132745663 [Ruditapes philippinarum]